MRVPDKLARYIAAKGSVCVDGISLTVNSVDGVEFELNIVPHTLAETTMDEFQPGRTFNLEVDIIARYLERLLLGETAAEDRAPGVSRELLQRCGFIGSAD
jgi:riboflavin synthase